MNLKKYLWNVLVSIDQFVNTLLLGNPDETISSRAGKAARDGKRWGCILCQFLDYFQGDHCKLSIEEDEV